MKKYILFVAVLLCFNGISIFAFDYDASLGTQVDAMVNTELDALDRIVLFNDGPELLNLSVSPEFTTDKEIYVSSNSGLYLSNSFDGNFVQNDSWPEWFKTEPNTVVYAGDYINSKSILAYGDSSYYLSYDRGATWTQYNPNTTETVLLIDFAPMFSSNNLIYYITNGGLYREKAFSTSKSLVLASDSNGAVTDFKYLRNINTDIIFYAVKGDKALRTFNDGSSFAEKEITAGIKQMEIIPDTTQEGDIALITRDNKLYYSNSNLDFGVITFPGPVTEIYSIRYVEENDSRIFVVLTNNGFYVTYNRGSTWSKINYSNLNVSEVSDYALTKSGTQYILFAIVNNKLYRDTNITGTFVEYMTGLAAGVNYPFEGSVVSKNIVELSNMKFGEEHSVTSATLIADSDLNGGSIEFFMSNNGGVTWEPITAEQSHTFTEQGLDLRWKAVLKTTDVTKTPILKSVNIDYGVDEAVTCAGFADIAYNDPDCAAFNYVKTNEIFTGYPDGSFLPDSAINRAETVKVITEGFDIHMLSADGTNLGFSDVETSEWYMGYLKTAKEAGIIEGYPDGTFKPEQTVNYAEMLKIFFETAEEVVPAAPPGSEWYQKYVNYADIKGLIKYTDVSIGMKRRDVAKLFYQWSLL